ncbi:uncharacterized protein IWZ02DRAFT_490369 [Phyllosticta citriasiana]|uniref:uncharacterized protein n=1 Tax=Phyllosticta citriasiana TaxID=595635 RepID=UPI0030FDCF08
MDRTNRFHRMSGTYTRVESMSDRDLSSDWRASSNYSGSRRPQEIELEEQPSSRERPGLDPLANAKYSSVETAVEVPAEDHIKSSSYGLLNNSTLENAHQSTRPGSGWWQGQMLVDRSLMIMANTILSLALVMIVICLALTPKFRKHVGWSSSTTSIAIFSGSETQIKNLSEGIKFVINIAATVILSASNTYQQLLTSLTIKDLKFVLTHFGDSRVGTNSPFAIKHKRSGHAKAWCGWIFLVATSMPIHLLANSVVGVAYYPENTVFEPTKPTPDKYNMTADEYSYNRMLFNPDDNAWVDFRIGAKYRDIYLRNPPVSSDDTNTWPYVGSCGNLRQDLLDTAPNPFNESANKCGKIVVRRIYYDKDACGALFGKLKNYDEAESEYLDSACWKYLKEWQYTASMALENRTCPGLSIKDQCTGSDIGYVASEEEACKSYKLVVRLLAALILAACTSAKAIYMVASNMRSRSKVKSHCLTFGDVIVAAVLEDIRIPSECLVNGGDFHRRTVSHTCHKHCEKGIVTSATGDEIGHCQKCKKSNIINNMPDLPWPTLATKSKKSLIANFGQTAVTQMLTLSFASTGMLVASIFVGLGFQSTYRLPFCAGWTTFTKASTRPMLITSFGGSFKSGLGPEMSAFAVSNGAQLIYSMLYLLLLYNISLICMEYEWGNYEKKRKRLRCTIVKSENFEQSYLLQMPAKIMLPIVAYSTTMHWLLGLAIYADETVMASDSRQDSVYKVVTVPSALWGSFALMLVMTFACGWAFTYSREGYIPQMFGSMRAVCSAASELNDFPREGIMWGDLTGKPPDEIKGAWRHAGLSSGPVDTVIPNELYAGRHGEPHDYPEEAHEALARKKNV